MARMFRSQTASFLLLQQHCSPGVAVDYAFLLPSVAEFTASLSPANEGDRSAPDNTQQGLGPVREKSNEGSVGRDAGRASQIWGLLHNSHPELNPSNIRLRIQISDDRFEDFKVDWDHSGSEMLVLHQGVRCKPSEAVKRAMADSVPRDTGNIARKYGHFFDVRATPPRMLVSYRNVEQLLWKAATKDLQTPVQSQESISHGSVSKVGADARRSGYFSNWTPHKARAARANIVERRQLWMRFLEKGTMTSVDFKQFSHFEPKAIVGFIHFLVGNGIATRSGDVFTLNSEVVPDIQRLLAEATTSGQEQQD